MPRRTATDKLLLEKAFNFDKNLKYDGYKIGFALINYKFFDKKTLGGAVISEIIPNQELAT